MPTQTYIVALGGNRCTRWGSPERLLSSILAGQGTIRLPGQIVAASAVRGSRPLGPSTRRFANAVAMIASDLSPPALLAALQAVERAAGRRRGRRWGARPLDLDIVGWSGGRWRARDLTIPHPRFAARAFVLAPLAMVAPDWRDPVRHLTTRHHAAQLAKKIARD